MTGKKLSTLGFLLEQLEIPTATLARYIHVDASLVSKWKSGDRHLSRKSAYFNEVIAYLMEENKRHDGDTLKGVLKEVYPLGNFKDEKEFKNCIQNLLTDRHFKIPKGYKKKNKSLCTVEVTLYDRGEGRRRAVSDLLDIAEAMESPGSIVYIDSEQYDWLLEDEKYAEKWRKRIFYLLERGFRAKFVIHFTVYKEKVVRFFKLCSPLIFHRNVEWFYHEYYDEDIYWFSFFILEHAMSVMGMSMGPGQSGTTVFTDAYSILQHKNVVEMVMKSSKRMFVELNSDNILEMLEIIQNRGRKDETMYAFLPAPAFVFSDPEVLREILAENKISEKISQRCLQGNKMLTRILDDHLDQGKENAQMIQIFQLEEMKRRITEEPFISCSLTLLGGRQIQVSRKQFAKGIRYVVERMREKSGFYIALASQKHHIQLPKMNCWCRRNGWMVHMDEEGVRFCEEITIINATSIALEKIWRKIPIEHKKKEDVSVLLLQLAKELEEEERHDVSRKKRFIPQR